MISQVQQFVPNRELLQDTGRTPFGLGFGTHKRAFHYQYTPAAAPKVKQPRRQSAFLHLKKNREII